MEVTAEMVKTLRENTGAGLMDCRKALTEAKGDMSEAEKILKKMGLAAIAKRADRATDNGRVTVYSGANAACVVSVACETDFVARNEDFKAACLKVAKTAVEKGYKVLNDELENIIKDLIAVIKENMSIKRFIYIPLKDNEFVESYIHADGAIGVAVKFQSSDKKDFSNDAVKTFMHDVALHIAAFQPQYLSDKDVDDKYKQEQMEIFRSQVASMDKPEKVKEGIVMGKMNKLASEICLLSQGFIKDESTTVQKMMESVSKSSGAKLSIVNYYCIKSGV